MFDVNNISEDRKNTGVWVDYMGGKFLVAHTSNLTFQRVFAKLQQPHLKKIERGTLDPKIHNKIMCESMAKGLLLDWKNVGSNNEPLDYSIDTAIKVLQSNDDLREYILDVAINIENFRKEEMEEQGE